MDKEPTEAQIKILPLLEQIDKLAHDIYGNWQDPDPRQRCIDIIKTTGEIRKIFLGNMGGNS